MIRAIVLLLGVAPVMLALGMATGVAHAAPPAPHPRGLNDAGGVRDVLPPGTDGTQNALELGAFILTGARPRTNDNQRAMYGELPYAVPGLTERGLDRFFKPSGFGVAPEEVARTYSPRDDVTIVRDRAYGVPHVTGRDRLGAMFGLGYAGAEDRLFFMDVLRNAGRAQLSSFAGGAEGSREMDAGQWAIAPYTEADLTRQFEHFDDLHGEEGRTIQRDIEAYVAGVNRYIAEARLDPTKLPGEYAAVNRPTGPRPWRKEDVIATASLVGAIFGKGGGRELTQGRLLELFTARFGFRRAERLWREWSAYEDGDAPTTLENRRYPYQVPSEDPPADAVALWDEGSLTEHTVRPPAGAASGARRGATKGLFGAGRLIPEAPSMSNALLVGRGESETGRPIAVFGPQTGYFSPQILVEEDVHAPASAAGPGIDARGAAFAGVNLYVQLGRGRDYAWSATSAGQDIIDVFALELCEPDGSRPTKGSMHYRYRGRCRPIEVLRRTNSWQPSAADQTPRGSETLTALRTQLGLVVGRATLEGRPVLYSQLRSTYRHEVDSAIGFKRFNDPQAITGAVDFQRAAHHVGYTFNWFYLDRRDIAYFNSGWNPQRAEGVDGQLPAPAKYAWRGYDPASGLSERTPYREHPRRVNGQAVMTSWNNKQAEGYAGADTNVFSSVFRSDMLDQEIRVHTEGPGRVSLPELTGAMQVAGVTDLRAEKVLYWALRLIGDVSDQDPALRDAVAKLRAWNAEGYARRWDHDANGSYEHAEAIAILDAWWPRWMEAQFRPVLGDDLFAALRAAHELDDEPNNGGAHLGSAYQTGWYGHAYKDIRTILRRKVSDPYGRRYCASGRRKECRRVLLGSLAEALTVKRNDLYGGDPVCDGGNDAGFSLQMCFDAVVFRPTGGVTQPLIHWTNRPTYQQIVSFERRAPR